MIHEKSKRMAKEEQEFIYTYGAFQEDMLRDDRIRQFKKLLEHRLVVGIVCVVFASILGAWMSH